MAWPKCLADQLIPALASSTATRRSISPRSLIQAVVAGTLLKVGGDRLKPQQYGLVDATGQQAELEFIECIERPRALFDCTAPALNRILDALQGDQRVDSAERTQGNGGSLRLRRFASRPG